MACASEKVLLTLLARDVESTYRVIGTECSRVQGSSEVPFQIPAREHQSTQRPFGI